MASHAPLAPYFIRFLFSTKPKFDCYFEFGNKSQGKPIGAVKLMLMAHSEVFRRQLEDSDLKEKGIVPVKDVHPDTFKGMLKFVYGHDTTSQMCFDEADNLLYVAEKYMMKTLKDKLAVRLMKLLNPDNICSLLNNPACYTHLELNSAITEILRFETDRILASPQFFCMNPGGFLKILKQDGLAVPEIELWRAAIKWAKHRADTEDGQLLRQQFSGLTQHMRLCSLTADEICTEVATTDVLTRDEIGAVCQSVGRKRKPEGQTEICDEIIPRKRLNRPNVLELANFKRGHSSESRQEYFFILVTKQYAIELLPLVCFSAEYSGFYKYPEYQKDKVKFEIIIIKEVNLDSPASFQACETPIKLTFKEKVSRGLEFEIPLAVNGKNVTLLPDSKYTVFLELHEAHRTFVSSAGGSCGNHHLTLVIPGRKRSGVSDKGGVMEYRFPSPKLQYRAVTVEPSLES